MNGVVIYYDRYVRAILYKFYIGVYRNVFWDQLSQNGVIDTD